MHLDYVHFFHENVYVLITSTITIENKWNQQMIRYILNKKIA